MRKYTIQIDGSDRDDENEKDRICDLLDATLFFAYVEGDETREDELVSFQARGKDNALAIVNHFKDAINDCLGTRSINVRDYKTGNVIGTVEFANRR